MNEEFQTCLPLRRMEFSVLIEGEPYSFSSLNEHSYLVSGPKAEYIVYKNGTWRCADEISYSLLERIGEVIESRKSVKSLSR